MAGRSCRQRQAVVSACSLQASSVSRIKKMVAVKYAEDTVKSGKIQPLVIKLRSAYF